SSRRRHTRWPRDWSSDVCSSDLGRVRERHRESKRHCAIEKCRGRSVSSRNIDHEVIRCGVESAGTGQRLKSLTKIGSADAAGKFGKYGGQYVPETLMEPLKTLADAYRRFSQDPLFKKELANWLEHYAGR